MHLVGPPTDSLRTLLTSERQIVVGFSGFPQVCWQRFRISQGRPTQGKAYRLRLLGSRSRVQDRGGHDSRNFWSTGIAARESNSPRKTDGTESALCTASLCTPASGPGDAGAFTISVTVQGQFCLGIARFREEVEQAISNGRFRRKPFINLSSTAALIRHLFALNAVIAAIKLNKIHIDLFSPEQKVGGSNPLGRTITPFISITFLRRVDSCGREACWLLMKG